MSAGLLYNLQKAFYIDKIPSITFNHEEDEYSVHAVSFFKYNDAIDDTNMTDKELLSIFALPNKQRIKGLILQMSNRCCQYRRAATRPIK